MYHTITACAIGILCTPTIQAATLQTGVTYSGYLFPADCSASDPTVVTHSWPNTEGLTDFRVTWEVIGELEDPISLNDPWMDNTANLNVKTATDTFLARTVKTGVGAVEMDVHTGTTPESNISVNVADWWQCNGDRVAYEVTIAPIPTTTPHLLSGIVTDNAATPVPIEKAVVSLYDNNYTWKDTVNTGADGKFSFSVPDGLYRIVVTSGTEGNTKTMWYPKAPQSASSVIKVIGKDVINRKFVFGSQPNITGVTGTIAKGNLITITGSGFGAKPGYLDFGGVVTKSASVVTSWSDTSINATVPAVVGNCVKVFSSEGGYSPRCVGGQ